MKNEVSMKDIVNAILEVDERLSNHISFEDLNQELDDMYSECSKISSEFNLSKERVYGFNVKKTVTKYGISYDCDFYFCGNKKPECFTIISKNGIEQFKKLVKECYNDYLSKLDRSIKERNQILDKVKELYEEISKSKYEKYLEVYLEDYDSFIIFKYEGRVQNVNLETEEVSIGDFCHYNDSKNLFIPINDFIKYLREEKLKKLIT